MKSAPMNYPNGAEVKVGDKVRFEQGGSTGIVERIIDTNFAEWSVHEPGVMLLSAPFGRVLSLYRCSSAKRLRRSGGPRDFRRPVAVVGDRPDGVYSVEKLLNSQSSSGSKLQEQQRECTC